MKLSFIQLSGFSSNWSRMKLTDEDLRRRESAIQAAPDAPPVMGGSGGLRKMRFSPASYAGGKSGGARACYACFPDFGLVYLCAVFPKNERANLSAELAGFRTILDAFRRYLREHWQKGWTP